MPQVDVVDLNNKKVGAVDLADEVFGVEVSEALLHQAVTHYLASRRAGTHKTKGRSEVSGSTRKLFRQKGTGRARAGSGDVSQRRGGGVVFGPTPRAYDHKLPKKVRQLALKTALSSKAAEGKLVVLEAATAEQPKTKELAARFSDLGWSSALVIDGAAIDDGFARAARNIPGIDVLPQLGANVYDILRRDTLVLTKDAVEALEARLK